MASGLIRKCLNHMAFKRELTLENRLFAKKNNDLLKLKYEMNIFNPFF